MTPISRRHLLLAGSATFAFRALPAAAGTAADIHVVKDPNCGCCTAWIDILRAAGFTVTTEDRTPDDLARFKRDSGIPPAMASCHTGIVDSYVLEGHVPVDDIRRLRTERPDAIGLAVPGMPYGSPGMGPEDEREAFTVYLLGRDGSTTVFTQYDAA